MIPEGWKIPEARIQMPSKERLEGEVERKRLRIVPIHDRMENACKFM